MAYTGKFLVNNEPLSPLIISGIGTFNAYSGDRQYRNRGGCTAVPNKGPIPAGKYWIVDRPTGGIRSKARAWLADEWNASRGKPTYHAEWFALYRDDGSIDDFTWVNGVKRGHFRLLESVKQHGRSATTILAGQRGSCRWVSGHI
ncbi:DUF2778 domain-containing protein [Paraburkholderia youngii]|uniref:DUF2778 domain-containing protein n=1 Tax=Paraburkholderia youngii TaxID=2782701 RepID=UPI003D1B929D